MSPARLNRARLPFKTGISTISFSYCTALEHPSLDLLGVGLFVVHRHGMNCACGVSSVFAVFGTCPCPNSVYDLNSPRDLLEWSALVSVVLVLLLELHLCRLDSLLDFSRVLGTWQWRCQLHRWSVCHSDELPEPESEAFPLFAVAWTAGTCYSDLNQLLSELDQRHLRWGHRPS